MLILQDQKLFESLALKKLRRNYKHLCFLMFWPSFALSVRTDLTCAEMCLHIQGQVLLVSSSNTCHVLKQKLLKHTDSRNLPQGQ